MDSEKIQAIKEWPTPKNISEVLFFLGFANFYRRFIKEYLKIALSLINLTKKILSGFKTIIQKVRSKNLKNNLTKN